MEKIEELEKYKKLLDDGAITEDEFRLMKQKILGLKTDEEKAAEKQAEREKALAEIEKLREEKSVRRKKFRQERQLKDRDRQLSRIGLFRRKEIGKRQQGRQNRPELIRCSYSKLITRKRQKRQQGLMLPEHRK